jgi:heme exporter protein C
MKRLLWFGFPITLALLAYGFYDAMFLAPTEVTMGNLYRIFYYHVPSATLALVFPYVNFLASLVYLASRRNHPDRALKADAIALASAEITLVFGTICLATGMLWAKPTWGIWWTWDPRLTSMLMLWLIYVSYLMLRRFAAAGDLYSIGLTTTVAAVLSIFAAVDVPIVYMSIRWWRTQHPAPVFFGAPGSGVAKGMGSAIVWNLVAWGAWGILMLTLRYQLERRRQLQRQESALQALEASLEVSN